MVTLPFIDTDWGAATGKLFIYLEYLFILIAFGVGAWFLWKYLQYKIDVLIIEPRGNTNKIYKDKAMVVTSGGNMEYKFFKRRKESMVATNDWGSLFSIGKKDFLMIQKLGFNLYRPITYKNPIGTLNVIDQDVLFYHFQKQKQLIERHSKPTFWDKYGNQAVFIIVMVICFVLIIVTLNKIDDVANALAGATQKAGTSFMQQLSGGGG